MALKFGKKAENDNKEKKVREKSMKKIDLKSFKEAIANKDKVKFDLQELKGNKNKYSIYQINHHLK